MRFQEMNLFNANIPTRLSRKSTIAILPFSTSQASGRKGFVLQGPVYALQQHDAIQIMPSSNMI